MFLSVDPMFRSTAPTFQDHKDARLQALLEISSGAMQSHAPEVDFDPVGDTDFASESPANFDPYRPSSGVQSSRPGSEIKLYEWDPPVDPRPRRPGFPRPDREEEDESFGPFAGPDGKLAGLGMDPSLRDGSLPERPQFGPPRWVTLDGPGLAKLIASNPYPYAYGLNNPISVVDLDGEAGVFVTVVVVVTLTAFTAQVLFAPQTKPPGGPMRTPGGTAPGSPPPLRAPPPPVPVLPNVPR